MWCKECNEKLVPIDYTEGDGRKKKYGVCFSCNKIYYIEKKRKGHHNHLCNIQLEFIPEPLREIVSTMQCQENKK
jgi:uncharacterized protein with PIN domain